MRSHQHAHVHANGLVSSHSLDFAFLQHAQQFRLHGHRHVANLVQKQRAAIRLLEFPCMFRGCPGERALLVPKQLRLDQFRRHRRAVQRHKRIFAPRRFLMNRARHQLLARPGFAQNAHTCFACRHAFNLRQQPRHGGSRSNQLVLAQPLAQFAIFIFQPRQSQRVFHRNQQFVRGKRLLKKIQRSQLRRAHRHLNVRLPGNQHDGSFHTRLLQVLQQLESAFSRHHHVGQNQIETLRTQQFQRTARVVAHGRFMARQAECAGKRSQGIRFVVNK